MINGTKCSTLRKNTAVIAKQIATPNANYCLNSTMMLSRPYHQITIQLVSQADHLIIKAERPTTPHRKPHPLPIKEKRSQPTTRNTIYVRTWTKELAEPGPFMDPGNTFPRMIKAIKSNMQVTYEFGTNTEHCNRQARPVTQPNTGVPHTPRASPMRCWIMNFKRGLNP